jgi:hypothetical protein
MESLDFTGFERRKRYEMTAEEAAAVYDRYKKRAERLGIEMEMLLRSLSKKELEEYNEAMAKKDAENADPFVNQGKDRIDRRGTTIN